MEDNQIMTKLTILLAILASAVSMQAQTMEQRKLSARIPVTLNCVRASSGGSKRITWATNYGSGTRENARSLTYDCTARWNGKTPTNTVLDVWFVGLPANGGKDIILENKLVNIMLNPSSNCVTSVTSAEIEHSKTDYAALGIREREGAKLRGCVVQLIMGGEVIRAYSSLGHLSQASWKTPFGSSTSGVIGEE